MSDVDEWISLHVFFHGEIDRLLVDAVGPALGNLAGGHQPDAPRHFFLRHWEGGPHLRLRVAAGHDAAEIRDHLEAWLGRYLSDHPSVDRMDDEHYQRMRRTAKQLEPENETMPELLPNNAVRHVDYQPEQHRFGRGESMRAAEAHFCESSELARCAIEAGTGARERRSVAFHALVTGWGLATHRWDALLERVRNGDLRFDPGIAVPSAALSEHYEQRRDELLELTRRALTDASRSAGERADPRHRWRRSIAVLLSRTNQARLGGGDRSGVEETGALALVDRCAHLLCNRLGVTLEAEAQLRFLACRALKEVMA